MELVEFPETAPHGTLVRGAVRGTQPPLKISAPQGREVSSRGQRPRKTASPHPPPLSPPAGRGVPKAGCGAQSGGCTPGYPICSPAGSGGVPHGPRSGGSTGLQCALNTRHCRPLQTVLKRLLVSRPFRDRSWRPGVGRRLDRPRENKMPAPREGFGKGRKAQPSAPNSQPKRA